jgi:hypothetical protein
MYKEGEFTTGHSPKKLQSCLAKQIKGVSAPPSFCKKEGINPF